MGMYTEWFIRMNLGKDLLDHKSKLVLENGISDRWPGDPDRSSLPDHPLFDTPRWGGLFYDGSYYFDGTVAKAFEWDEIGKFWKLTIAGANLKNYNDEIALAFDWLLAMDNGPCGAFRGFYRCEEGDDPTLVYIDQNRKPVYHSIFRESTP